jgi:ADP-heptose:LPS heptosyltransferase
VSRSRALVIQLARIGDILQTTAILRRMRAAAPDRELHLVVIDGFSVPVPGRLVDRIHTFPLVALSRMLKESPHDWGRALAVLAQFVESLGREPFDLAVNLTIDDYSGLLMSQAPASRRVGLSMTEQRTRAVHGDWMRYFWATARSRALRAFNLVDLFSWSAGGACDRLGLEMEIPAAARESMNAWLSEKQMGERPLIALQLGASAEIRQWRPERFAAMVDSLDDSVADFVLVGTESERSLAQRFFAASSRGAIDAVGRTSLGELGALLQRCRLLVTNDTGTMHVATAVGTPVVELTIGPAFAHETGPYGAGHFVVEPTIACFPCTAGSECSHLSCHAFLDPREAAAVVRFALGLDSAPPPIAAGRLLESRFAASGRVEYAPVGRESATDDDAWRALSAVMWEESFGVRRDAGGGREPEASLPVLSRADSAAAIDALDRVMVEAREAERLVRGLPSAPGQKQARLAARAHEHLERLLSIGEMTPVCRPVVGVLRVEIESIDAADIATISARHANAYRSASVRAGRLASLGRGRFGR